MEQQALVPRREVWEFGLLPLQSMLPSLDTGSLLSLHARLLEASSSASHDRSLTADDIARVLDLHPSQAEAMVAILDSISIYTSSPPDASNADPTTLDESSITASPHDLSMFLLAQLFSKEAHRADTANESWPAPASTPPPTSSSSFMMAMAMEGMSPNSSLSSEPLSPTRRDSNPSFLNNSLRLSSSSSARTLLRQQLQQHIKTQANALRGYGEFLRRHLDLILDLARDPLPPPQPSHASTSVSPSVGAPHFSVGAAMTEQEVDRLGFLFTPHPQTSEASTTSTSTSTMRVSVLVPSLLAPAPTTNLPVKSVPVDEVLSGLRQTWFEESLDSPRLVNLGSSLSSSSSSPWAIRSLGLKGPSNSIQNGAQEKVDGGSISGLYKGTVVRGESDFAPPPSSSSSNTSSSSSPSSSLRIIDCHDATVYVLAPLQHVLVSGCSDCTIVVGAVGGILRVDRCDKVTVIAAGRRVVASSCHDCTFFLGVTHRPILMGDNRFLRLAPYNTKYERQSFHLSTLNIKTPLSTSPLISYHSGSGWNKWESPIVFAAKERKVSGNGSSSNGLDSPRGSLNGVGVGGGGGGIMDLLGGGGGRGGSGSGPSLRQAFSLLPPDEFLPFVIPFTGGPGSLAGGPAHPNTTRWSSYGGGLSSSRSSSTPYLFPLPPDYEQSLLRKLGMTSELRNKFKQASLGKEKEKELNDAIQAHFREWLQASGHLRQIYDLSNLEREGEMTRQG